MAEQMDAIQMYGLKLKKDLNKWKRGTIFMDQKTVVIYNRFTTFNKNSSKHFFFFFCRN